MAGLGIKVAASTVWEILKVNGMDPARHRAGPTWTKFLRSQAGAILASDFFTVDLLDGTQACVLAVIEHATRRIRILGATPHPTGEWTTQSCASGTGHIPPASAGIGQWRHADGATGRNPAERRHKTR